MVSPLLDGMQESWDSEDHHVRLHSLTVTITPEPWTDMTWCWIWKTGTGWLPQQPHLTPPAGWLSCWIGIYCPVPVVEGSTQFSGTGPCVWKRMLLPIPATSEPGPEMTQLPAAPSVRICHMGLNSASAIRFTLRLWEAQVSPEVQSQGHLAELGPQERFLTGSKFLPTPVSRTTMPGI